MPQLASCNDHSNNIHPPNMRNDAAIALNLDRILRVRRAGAQTDHIFSSVRGDAGKALSVLAGGSTETIVKGGISSEGKAVFLMAIAMAIHYLGYSFARPSTLALFTSKKTGFVSSAAFPFAMAFVSPVSLLLLFLYGVELEKNGPRLALRYTTFYCGTVLVISAALIKVVQERAPFMTIGPFRVLQTLVGALFVFRESYVQLLTSQMWSFMASVLTPSQSATWFAPISGLTSISSAAAGLGVSRLVNQFGLLGILGASGVALLGSVFFSEAAYAIAIKDGFNPEDEYKSKHKTVEKSKGRAKDIHVKEKSIVDKATEVFTRVPTLAALFREILACQGLSTVLNVLFVTKLKEVIPDDGDRAGYMGKFFGSINIISCVAQFAILPQIMQRIDPSVLWKIMPTIMLAFTTYQSLQINPSLKLVSACFLVMKTLEFSVRRMLDELVYVPLDFESRYVGKEVIGVFGYRFGKSGMSLGLSGLASLFGTVGLQQLSYITSGTALLWTVTAVQLSNLVPSREEAESAHEKMKRGR